MTELELLKNEYRELPVPAEGPQQMLQSIAKARHMRKRALRKTAITYALAVAAVVVVVISKPMLRFGVDSAKKSSEATSMDTGLWQESGNFNGAADAVMEEKPMGDFTDKEYSMEQAVEETMEGSMEDSMASVVTDSMTAQQKNDNTTAKARSFSEEEQNRISKEILRQMKEQMEEPGIVYYVKSEEYPEGFELISAEQTYYVNAEKFVVIVFEAGKVAPKELGKIEFVIPAEIVSP